MNTETGQIMNMDAEAFKAMPTEERKKFVEVKRDLTVLETAAMQIKMYSSCGCGSGKKFKFCCHTKP